MRRFITTHFIPLSSIVFIALFLTRSLWATGSVPDTHDGIYHAVRMAELWDMLKNGQFPVRWAGNLDGGFGIPLFNYVYPLPYYLGLPLIALGFSPFWAVKAVTILAYLLGGIGVYLLSHKHKLLGFAGATLYLTTPYQLLNIFVRGALGEVLALGLIPLVVWTGLDLAKNRLKWYHPLPLALLFLSHNFLSFLFLPVYFILVYRANFSVLLRSSLISFGLASWYLIPAIGEASLLHSVTNADYTFRYSDHFVYPLQLLWSKWGTGLSVAGRGDGLSFQLGLAQILALLVAGYYALSTRKHSIILLLTLVSLLLMLPSSQFIWDLFPPLQLTQFPWRLLFLPTFLIPYLYLQVGHKHLAVILPIILLSLGFSLIFAHPRYPQSESQYMSQWYANRYGTTTSMRGELLPKWVSGAPSPEYLPHNYFPTWVAHDSQGKVVPLSPSLTGQIAYDHSQAVGDLTLTISQTNLERLANFISMITIVILFFI